MVLMVTHWTIWETRTLQLISVEPVFTHQLGEGGGSQPSGGESHRGTAVRNLPNIGKSATWQTLEEHLHQFCTSMHSKERVESVCQSLPERNSQEAASENEERDLILFELTLIDLYQLFLHTLQSPHWSRFPPVMPLCKSNLNSTSSFLSAFKFICPSACSSHTAEVVWNGPSLKVVKWILRKAVFRFAMRQV